MQTTPAGWTIIDREARVLALNYHFAAEATSTSFVAPMADGRLMVVSPSKALDEAVATELADFGEVGALVANNGFHYLGQKAWRARFPEARCFAPPKAIERIARKSRHPLAFEPLAALAPLLGDGVGFRDVPDSKCGESWFWARLSEGEGGERFAWYMSDVLANMPGVPGNLLVRALFKLTGSAPGYRVFKLALKLIVRDVEAALRLLLADVEAHPPGVVVPAHGGILADGDVDRRTVALLKAAL